MLFRPSLKEVCLRLRLTSVSHQVYWLLHDSYWTSCITAPCVPLFSRVWVLNWSWELSLISNHQPLFVVGMREVDYSKFRRRLISFLLRKRWQVLCSHYRRRAISFSSSGSTLNRKTNLHRLLRLWPLPSFCGLRLKKRQISPPEIHWGGKDLSAQNRAGSLLSLCSSSRCMSLSL